VSRCNPSVIPLNSEVQYETDDIHARERCATTWLFLIFAALALILSAIGVYGIVSYLTAQRTHEVGVRMALGARPKDILRLILAQGGKMALLGVAIGVAGSLAMMRLLSSLLYGVSATDPITFVGAAVLLTLVALAACYIPGRRAMRVNPAIALRYE
jgi:putative ABC transport system permease protein